MHSWPTMQRMLFWVGASCLAVACGGDGPEPMGAPSLGSSASTATDSGSEMGTSSSSSTGLSPDTSSGETTDADASGSTSGAMLCESVSFEFTGTEQSFDLPSGARFLHVKAWGAGGNHDTNECQGEGDDVGTGGVGGFTEAVVPVVGGDVIKIVVGEYGNQGNATAQGDAGFGGGRGGGFSGVFTGSDPLTEFDRARALAVAGGGGAAASTQCVPGVPGNHPDGGGQSTMQGEMADGAGGGGGYEGGSASSSEGSRGGTGFVTPDAIAQVIEWAEFGDPVPPRTEDVDFAEGTAASERNGHVKLYVYCSEDDIPPIEG